MAHTELTNRVAQYAPDGTLLNLFEWADTKAVYQMLRSFERLSLRPEGLKPGRVYGFFDKPAAGQRIEWDRRAEGGEAVRVVRTFIVR